MKKSFKILLSVVTVAAIAIGAYIVMNKQAELSIEKYLTNDTEAVLYTDLQSEDYKEVYNTFSSFYDDILDGYKEMSDEEGYKALEKVMKFEQDFLKYTNEVLLLVESTNFENVHKLSDMKISYIVDLKTDLADLYLPKYFKKLDSGVYVLKDEKVKEDLKKYFDTTMSSQSDYDFDSLIDSTDVYTKKIGGKYVFTFNKDYLIDYSKRIGKSSSESFVNKFNELRATEYSMLLIDGGSIYERYSKYIPENPYITKLGYIYSKTDFDKKNLSASLIIDGEGSVFDILDSSQLTERKLTNYNNSALSLYFANNSFADLSVFINDIITSLSGRDYLNMASTLTGIDPKEFIANLGDELVLNFNSQLDYNAILNNKEPKMLTKILDSFGVPKVENTYILGPATLALNNNKIFINNEPETVKNDIDWKNLSLYLSFDIDKLFATFGNFSSLYNGDEKLFFTTDLFLYTNGKNLEFKAVYNIDDLKNFYKNFPKLMNEIDNQNYNTNM